MFEKSLSGSSKSFVLLTFFFFISSSLLIAAEKKDKAKTSEKPAEKVLTISGELEPYFDEEGDYVNMIISFIDNDENYQYCFIDTAGRGKELQTTDTKRILVNGSIHADKDGKKWLKIQNYQYLTADYEEPNDEIDNTESPDE